VFQAPGRVNLIGEHTDYNDGFVMPAAIDFHTWIAAGSREDRRLVIHSQQFNETREFDLDDRYPKPLHHWSDYVRGVIIQLQRGGLEMQGANLLITGNVPFGAGVSSSASIEMATAFALTSLFGGQMDKRDLVELAKLCQKAENEFVGARCGIMDQFISANGRAGHALMLDCRSLEFQLLPIPNEIRLVICNTMVKHQIATGEYNIRRRECEQGVERLRERLPQIRALRDVTLSELNANADLLEADIYRRCHHVISENERVLKAAAALKESSLDEFGRLMYESHESLRKDYQVSCPELDIMVTIAHDAPGVIGARMTGGGFGGSTINLVAKKHVDEFCAIVASEYESKTGIQPSVLVTSASDGASEVTA
jgi:galactokinase